MESTIYKPLDISKNEIRLVIIEASASLEDAVNFTINTVALNESLQYDALSWCWGDPRDTATLQLNGNNIQCPRNLDVALRYLRSTVKATTWWVDALCINQNDLEEKSSQIPLMGDIYRQAQVVRVWLGEAADNSDEAITLIQRLLGGSSLFERIDGQFISKEQYGGLSAFFQRPWWSRTWVLQEFVLARRVIFYCGHACFNAEGIREWATNVIAQARNAGDDFWSHMIAEDLDGSIIMEATSKLILYDDTTALMKQGSGPGSFNAVKILCELSSLQATDQRDKVFGGLGLLDPSYTKAWKTISNWYTRTTELVYALTTFSMIQSIKNLYALCFIPERSQSDLESLSKWLTEIEETNSSIASRESAAVLPSWSIDFSRNSRKRWSLNVWFDCVTHRLTSGKTVLWDYPFLKLGGIDFDEIIATHAIHPDLKDMGKGWGHIRHMRQLHSKWRSFFGIQYKDSTAYRTYIGGGSMEDAYWRTVVGDTREEESFMQRRMTSETIKSQVRWLMQKDGEIVDYADDWSRMGHGSAGLYNQSLALRLQTRSKNGTAHLFITKRGYMGLSVGRSTAAVGDSIQLLVWGDTPFILRPCGDPTKKTYIVICECYIDGIMDGQVFNPPPDVSTLQRRRDDLRRKVFGGSLPDPMLPVKPVKEWDDIRLI